MTPKEVDILRLYLNGKSKNYIQKELHTSKILINKILKAHNITDYTQLMFDCGLRRCKHCEVLQPLDNFGKRLKGDRFNKKSYCKKCGYEKYKEQYSNYKKINKDKIKVTATIWRDNNRDKLRISGLKFYEKIKNDPIKKLSSRIKSAMSECISFNKSNPYLKTVGYSIEDLKERLESTFTEGMSWENYGRNGWHIDHIKPLAMFSITSEEIMQEAWALSNLQALWWYDNIRKSSIYNGKRYKSTLK